MIIKDRARPGVELARIVLVNWYGFSRIDVVVRGNIALIGRNGAGKSSLIDAVQLVLSGGNRHYFSPNASAEVTSGASRREERRSVLDYCLGKVGGRVLRPETISYVVLVFRSTEGDDVWSAGMAMSGREGDSDVADLGSFIAPGFDLTTDDFVRDGRTRTYDEVMDAMRKVRGGSKVQFLRNRPVEFSTKLLREITGNVSLDGETYLRALKNSLAFKAMEDPTDFMRRYVLPAPGLSSSKIEGLRRSYANWRSIEERIRKAAAEKDEGVRIANTIDSLVERRRELSRWSAVESLADHAVAERDHVEAARAVASAGARIAEVKRNMDASRAALAELDGVIALSRAELGEQKIREEVAARRSEQARAEADVKEAAGRRARIIQGLMGVASLRPLIAEEAAALDGGDVVARIDAFSKAAVDGDSMEAALRPLVSSLEGFAARAEQAEGLIRDDMASLRASSSEDQQALQRFRQGGALIGDRTVSLMAELSRAGISFDPLCSLVEVVDERWRDAAETLLGPAREALIVSPADVPEAIRILEGGGQRFHGCLIYDAKDQDRASPSAPRDTLASKLHTDNPYARAFLNIRIGNVRCVERRDELRLHNRAVTAGMLSKGGGAISMLRVVRDRLLGLTAQAGSAEDLARRIEASVSSLSRLTAQAARLRRIAAGTEDFLAAALMAEGLGKVEQDLVDAMNRGEGARDAAAKLELSLTSDKFKMLRDLEADRAGHAEDLAADETEFAAAASAEGKAAGKLEATSLRVEESAARLDVARSTLDASLMADAEDLFGKLVNSRGSAAEVGREARAAIAQGGGKIEQRLAAVRQEAANYARDHAIEFNAGDTFEELAEWIRRRLVALEADVLAKYRDDAVNARAEMEKSIYDDFILTLANDLTRGRNQVRYLNNALGAHVFNGERFAFTDTEHKDFADIVALSRAVLNSERRISDLFEADLEKIDDLSDREARGMRKIRSIFEGGGDVDHFTDYRNYLTFDLVSYDAATNARIAGSRERSKRSGGERQVPFYIAMASAMASVCFRGRKRGMGFAMFDEAFNALDNGNISASLGMMQQLGLQFLLSAPTEKASAFIPHVDTVINISRHDAYCQIDIEYPKEHARVEMLARDPSISGASALMERPASVGAA